MVHVGRLKVINAEVNYIFALYQCKMCKECVKQEYPNRGTICLESGSYLMNFAGCIECQKKDIKTINKTEENEEGEETITYQHICEHCEHIIAEHVYKFAVVDEFQEYEMNCLLCGYAEDTRSIMPDDPRQQPLFM